MPPRLDGRRSRPPGTRVAETDRQACPEIAGPAHPGPIWSLKLFHVTGAPGRACVQSAQVPRASAQSGARWAGPAQAARCAWRELKWLGAKSLLVRALWGPKPLLPGANASPQSRAPHAAIEGCTTSLVRLGDPSDVPLLPVQQHVNFHKLQPATLQRYRTVFKLVRSAARGWRVW